MLKESTKGLRKLPDFVVKRIYGVVSVMLSIPFALRTRFNKVTVIPEVLEKSLCVSKEDRRRSPIDSPSWARKSV